MGSMSRNTSRLSTRVNPAIITKDWTMLFFSLAISRSPYRMENTAPLPMDIPSRMEVRKVIRV